MLPILIPCSWLCCLLLPIVLCVQCIGCRMSPVMFADWCVCLHVLLMLLTLMSFCCFCCFMLHLLLLVCCLSCLMLLILLVWFCTFCCWFCYWCYAAYDASPVSLLKLCWVASARIAKRFRIRESKCNDEKLNMLWEAEVCMWEVVIRYMRIISHTKGLYPRLHPHYRVVTTAQDKHFTPTAE